MDDPFAPSTDPDIPTPTRDDLLRLLYDTAERTLLAAGKLESGRSETLWKAARRQWDEGHKRKAERRRSEGKKSEQAPKEARDAPVVKESDKPILGHGSGAPSIQHWPPRTETDEERRTREQGQIEAEVIASMQTEDREKYHDPGTPEARRKAILETYKDKLEERKQREDAEFRKELDRTAKARDLLSRIESDPTKAHLQRPADDSKKALLEWFDEMSKPHRPVPFPNPPPEYYRQQRIAQALLSGQRPDPQDIAEEEAEAERYQKNLAEARDKKRKELETESTKPDLGPLQAEVDRATKVMGEAAEILRHKPPKVETKTLPPRWLNRFAWFRWLMGRPKLSEGSALVMAGAILLKGLDWQIDGAIKTAAVAFLAAWVVFSFAIYISSHWDKRRSWMMVAMVIVAVGLGIVWYSYLPEPQSVKSASSELRPVASSTVAESGETRVFTDVDPGYLVGLYKRYSTAQADQAVKTYIGKWVRVTGTVGDVTREDRPREPLTASVSIHIEKSHKDQEAYVIVASFEDQTSVDRALVLSRKESVTIMGKIRRVIEPGIILDKCEFVESPK